MNRAPNPAAGPYLAAQTVGGRLIVIGPNSPDVGADDLASCIDYFKYHAQSNQLNIEWHAWNHDRPIELTSVLLEAGFESVPTEPLFLAQTKDVVSSTARVPNGMRLRMLESVEDVVRIVTELQKQPEADPNLAEELPAAVRAGYNEVFVVESEPSLVGCAWVAWKSGTEFAGLAGAFC